MGRLTTVSEALESIGQCKGAVLTSGLFSGQKCVWWKDVAFLQDNQIGKSKEIKSRIDTLIEPIKKGLPEGHILVISAPKADGRLAFVKACKAMGSVEVFDHPLYEKGEQSCRAMVKKWMGDAGYQPAQGVIDAFVEKVGTDSRLLRSEIDKMICYKGTEKNIQMDDVRMITTSSRESAAWDLADAVGNKSFQRALDIVDNLLSLNQSAVGLVIGLSNRFEELLVLRTCYDKGWLVPSHRMVEWEEDEAGAQLLDSLPKDPRKMHPYRTKILLEQGLKYSSSNLKLCWRKVLQSQERLVSSSIASQLVLETLIMDLMRIR